MLPDMKPGGSWSPEDCFVGQKVAIIIPYRDREEHLKLFLANLIPFLRTQKRSFTIFVVEQVCTKSVLQYFFTIGRHPIFKSVGHL